MKRHKVLLKVNATGQGELLVDGVALSVRAVHICAHAGELTSVSLELVNCEVFADVDGTLMALVDTEELCDKKPIIPVMLRRHEKDTPDG